MSAVPYRTIELNLPPGLRDAGDEVPLRMVEVTVDDHKVTVPEGATLLDACRALDIDTPTLCWGETLRPANACRVCMVELEGARTLVPACSRRAEEGMVVRTDSERVRLNRRMVLEFLASSVDLSTTPGIEVYLERYAADPERYGPPAPPDPGRGTAQAGRHKVPDGQTAATVAGPPKLDNELYMRDYSKCVLCYKCVDACGDQHQNTFAITVAGRGFDAHVSTEYANPLPESACVYCGNCIAVCPTGALMPVSEYELRQANEWDESRQTETETICAFCGVGCSLTLHVQDERIVKVTSPADHDVTLGNLCIKGRFGFEHVQPRDRQGQGRPAPSEAAGRDPLGGNGAPPEPAAPEAEIDPSPPEASAATPGRDAPGSATSDQQ